jgi:flagellar hook-associated protein FlgK
MFSVPLAGMKSAENLVDTTASRIAGIAESPGSDEGSQTGIDTVELSDEMAALIQATAAFQASGRALESEDRMIASVLNMTA